MNIKQKLVSGFAIATMVAAVVAPASFAAGNSVYINHNGWFSHNSVHVTNWNRNSVGQGNSTFAETNVGTFSNTGGNHSSFNVWGGGSIDTGNVTNTTTITNSGSSNNNTNPCGCGSSPTNTISVDHNGAFSSNHVKVVNGNSNSVTQVNETVAETSVITGSNTGGNSSSFNVGGGATITSGNASTTTTVTNGGSSNSN